MIRTVAATRYVAPLCAPRHAASVRPRRATARVGVSEQRATRAGNYRGTASMCRRSRSRSWQAYMSSQLRPFKLV